MNWLEIMKQRHSVRQYEDKEIPESIREKLKEQTVKLNQLSGLHMQLLFDEPECFQKGMAHYGNFSGVRNYIAVVGRKRPDEDERAGYYGEMLVLYCQSLGLNTCWVALTHGKTRAVIRKGERLAAVIALGYGLSQGNAHHNKPAEELYKVKGEMPDWFKKGMEGAMAAPTAVNQQKFLITYDGSLKAEVNGRGFYTKLDLGIVKCNFELASGHHFE